MLHKLLNNRHQHLLALFPLLFLSVDLLHARLVHTFQSLNNLGLSLFSSVNVCLEYSFELSQLLCELPVDPIL